MAFFGALHGPNPSHGECGNQSTTGTGFGQPGDHNATNTFSKTDSRPQQSPEARPSPTVHSTCSNRNLAANNPVKPGVESMPQGATIPPNTESPPPPLPQASVEDTRPSASTASNNIDRCETEDEANTTDGEASGNSMEWTSSVNFLKQQLYDQRGNLLSRRNKMDELSGTMQKQETIISALKAPEALAGSLVDEVLQETIRNLRFQITARWQSLEAFNLRVQTGVSAVDGKINQLGLLSGKSDGDITLGMPKSAILQQAHEVYNSNQSDCPNLDILTTEMETMLGLLWLEIRSLQAFLLASQLGYAINKLSLYSTKLRSLDEIATVIWQSHLVLDTNKETYASHITLLQKV
ncbi:hypothetical protein BDV06DRAFT_227077 [Aspergillus oleicola]